MEMPEDYKTSKEAFVSHHSGSTITHINLISSVALSSIALHSALRSRLPHKYVNLVTEFILLVLPLLLSITVFANNPLILNVALVIPATWLLSLSPLSCQSLPSSGMYSKPQSPTKSRSPGTGHSETTSSGLAVTPLSALTTYRAHMLLMTSLCILAVDFPIFPRSLAKCETFGVSLMDLGVGSFVFSQGVVSAIPLLKDISYMSAPLLLKLTKVSRKVLPLIVLGLLRVVLVKRTEYPEHESEYGTHWNFFLTLAALPLLQVLLHPILLSTSILGSGLWITILHQLILSYTSLQSWTLNAARTNIIAQNKEGLVSLPGYLAIHVLGLLTGMILLPPSPSDFRRLWQRIRRDSLKDVGHTESHTQRRSRQNAKTAIELFSYAVIWWCLYGFANIIGFGGDGVSRRLANTRYVLWIVAYNTSFITAYLSLDILFFSASSESNKSLSASASSVQPSSPPQAEPALLLEAVNLNGFLLFLLANVATGLVNFMIPTMYTSDRYAIVILSLYAFALSAGAWSAKKKRIWKF